MLSSFTTASKAHADGPPAGITPCGDLVKMVLAGFPNCKVAKSMVLSYMARQLSTVYGS